MEKIRSVFRPEIIRFRIEQPEDFRDYVIQLFRLVGIPGLVIFTILDFSKGRLDEGFFSLTILIAFIISTQIRSSHPAARVIHRIAMGLLAGNFIYVLAVNPDTKMMILWLYLIPLPVALLFGVREGAVWIMVTAIFSILALIVPPHQALISLTFVSRFGVTFFALGMLSLTAEYVRQRTMTLYLNKQKELMALNERISGEVLLDPLTGGYNRGFLSDLFPGLLEYSRSADVPLTIILCDIDQFKEINDTHGHIQGDRILKETAEIFLNNLRSGSDNLVRYGGDEFLIVLRNARLEDAARLAERLRSKLAAHEFRDINFHVTCSFGLAQLQPTDVKPTRKETAAQLIARADQNLYEAKDLGRNQVIYDRH